MMLRAPGRGRGGRRPGDGRLSLDYAMTRPGKEDAYAELATPQFKNLEWKDEQSGGWRESRAAYLRVIDLKSRHCPVTKNTEIIRAVVQV